MSSRGKQKWAWPQLLIGSVLMLTGAWIFLQPAVESFLNSRVNAELTDEYVTQIEAVEGTDPGQLAESLRQAQEYNADLTPGSLHDPWAEDDLVEDPEQAAYSHILSDAGAMARVKVPSVNIDLPVFHGTDRATLTRGAGHLYGTSLPVGGPDTHAVISAHTGMRALPFFDRLVDVVIGDLIYIDAAGQRLTYEVEYISLVLPHELEAVAVVPGQDLVTLLTCHTPPENTHRLLVRGHRVGEAVPVLGSPKEATPPSVQGMTTPVAPEQQPSDDAVAVDYSIQEWMRPRLLGGAVAIGLWLLMLVGWGIGDLRRKRAARRRPQRAQ